MSKQEWRSGTEIAYGENDGRIYFVYGKSSLRVPVPKDVQKKGREAIREYAEKHVLKDLRRREKMENFAKNPDFPVETRCGKTILKGKIVSAENNAIKVRLEKPVKYRGERSSCFGWAAAMAGQYIFDGNGWFSKAALEEAQRLLMLIYENRKYTERHRDVIKLVKKLNA